MANGSMTVESAPIETLSADPANVCVHSGRNLDAIKASLKRFGQQKPIVVDAKGIVRAGNGTLIAAQALGWKHVAIVRTELAGTEATAYAIADNRTTDLSDWDEEALAAQLQSLQADGLDLRQIGFDAREVGKLLHEKDESEEQTLGEEKWMVIVTCKDEADQAAFLRQMDDEGRNCKAVMA